MYTIKNEIENEIIIKNSKFITVLIPINDTKKINEIIDTLKIKYPKATHYCYAYVTKDHQKSSDDKEPSSTAGLPMLNVLLKNNIINVLAVTIRYFGGIKLGSGGLVRAYSKSVSNALEKSTIIELEKALTVEIKTAYENQKQLDYILKNANILSKEFKEEITYTAIIPICLEKELSAYNYKILTTDSYIEKNKSS